MMPLNQPEMVKRTTAELEGMEYDASLYYAVGDRYLKNYMVKCDLVFYLLPICCQYS